MTKKAPEPHEMWLATGVVLLFLALAVAGSAYFGWRLNQRLQAEGIEVTGTVAFKLEKYVSSGRGGGYEPFFTIYYFDRSGDGTRPPLTLDVLGEEITFGTGNAVGEFHSADVRVTDDLYAATQEGDDVAVVYLPDDPEEIWLKQSVDEWSLNVPVVLTAVFILLGLVSIRQSSRSKNKAQQQTQP
jgi:hypothetical protein